jgi:hypothetical protein
VTDEKLDGRGGGERGAGDHIIGTFLRGWGTVLARPNLP